MVELEALAWWAGSANTPQLVMLSGSNSPVIPMAVWAFDAAAIERVYTTFRMPDNYASGGSLIIHWQTIDTNAEDCRWGAQVSAVTPGDADTILEHAWSTLANVDSPADTNEARRLISATITLNMDSAAAGDRIHLMLERTATHANDDLTSDAELIGATFTYTTS